MRNRSGVRLAKSIREPGVTLITRVSYTYESEIALPKLAIVKFINAPWF